MSEKKKKTIINKIIKINYFWKNTQSLAEWGHPKLFLNDITKKKECLRQIHRIRTTILVG